MSHHVIFCSHFSDLEAEMSIRTDLRIHVCMYVCMYIGFKTFFYVVRHLDSIASYLPTGLHLGFFHSWPSLFLPSSFSSVFLVLSFVSASTSMLFKGVTLQHIRKLMSFRRYCLYVCKSWLCNVNEVISSWGCPNPRGFGQPQEEIPMFIFWN